MTQNFSEKNENSTPLFLIHYSLLKILKLENTKTGHTLRPVNFKVKKHSFQHFIFLLLKVKTYIFIKIPQNLSLISKSSVFYYFFQHKK